MHRICSCLDRLGHNRVNRGISATGAVRAIRGLASAAAAALLVGCNAAPATTQHMQLVPELRDKQAVAVIVDSCIEKMPLTGGDTNPEAKPFVALAEARQAHAVFRDAILSQIPKSVRVRQVVSPVLCGARSGTDEKKQRVANTEYADTRIETQMLAAEASGIPDRALATDSALVAAYVHKQVLRLAAVDASRNWPGTVQYGFVDESEVLGALKRLADRSGVSAFIVAGEYGKSFRTDKAMEVGIRIVSGEWIPRLFSPGKKTDADKDTETTGRTIVFAVVNAADGSVRRYAAKTDPGDPNLPAEAARREVFGPALERVLFVNQNI